MVAGLWSIGTVLAAMAPPPRRPGINPDRVWPKTFSQHISRGMSLAVAEAQETNGLRSSVRVAAKLPRKGGHARARVVPLDHGTFCRAHDALPHAQRPNRRITFARGVHGRR